MESEYCVMDDVDVEGKSSVALTEDMLNEQEKIESDIVSKYQDIFS